VVCDPSERRRGPVPALTSFNSYTGRYLWIDHRYQDADRRPVGGRKLEVMLAGDCRPETGGSPKNNRRSLAQAQDVGHRTRAEELPPHCIPVSWAGSTPWPPDPSRRSILPSGQIPQPPPATPVVRNRSRSSPVHCFMWCSVERTWRRRRCRKPRPRPQFPATHAARRGLSRSRRRGTWSEGSPLSSYRLMMSRRSVVRETLHPDPRRGGAAMRQVPCSGAATADRQGCPRRRRRTASVGAKQTTSPVQSDTALFPVVPARP